MSIALRILRYSSLFRGTKLLDALLLGRTFVFFVASDGYKGNYVYAVNGLWASTALIINSKPALYGKVRQVVDVKTGEVIYSALGWCEREIFEFNGVAYHGNSDLRRLLTDYGYDVKVLKKY